MLRFTHTAAILLLLTQSACDKPQENCLPPGMIAMFDGFCPDGWTNFEPLEGRFPRASIQAGDSGGSENHTHRFDITARTSKDGQHIHLMASGDPVQIDVGKYGFIGIQNGYIQAFEEAGKKRVAAPRARAETDTEGEHDHMISVMGSSEANDHLPPYLDLVFCRKD